MPRKRAKVAGLIIVIGVATALGIIFLPGWVDSWGPIPQFVSHDWLELDKMDTIGKFHSTLGHGYGALGDNNPTSDKHYYYPAFNWGNTNSSVMAFSPVSARVIKIEWEQHRLSDGSIQGKQLHLQSIEHPSIVFKLFHLNVEPANLSLFQIVEAGQFVGYLDMREFSGTDIAVTRGGVEISWFQVITDSLFAKYQARGISTRDMMIKNDAQVAASKAEGYNFTNSDPTDLIALKNTNYTKLLANSLADPSHFDKVSYIPNSLSDLTWSSSPLNQSFILWMHIKPAYAGTFSTDITAPFDGKVAQIGYYPSGNYSVKVIFYAPTYNFTVTFFEVNHSAGLTDGDPITQGQVLGQVKEYLGILTAAENYHTPIPCFSVMQDSPWNGWQARGITNQSTLLFTVDEFVKFQDTYYLHTVDFAPDSPWWVNLS